jgi:hypothetical protein
MPMSSEKPLSNDGQSATPPGRRDAAGARAAAPVVPLLPSGKSGEIGCVFAGLAVRVVDRSPDDYAVFLEEL